MVTVGADAYPVPRLENVTRLESDPPWRLELVPSV